MSNVPFGPPPSGGSSSLQILEDPGVQGGVNLDAAPHEIPPGMGRFLKDVLLDVPGIVRQRGPLNTKGVFPGLPSSHRVIGLTSLQDPNGTNFFRIMLITSDRNSPNHVYAWFYGHSSSTTTVPFHARSFFDLMDFPADGRLMGEGTIYFDDRRGNATNVGAFVLITSIDLTAETQITGLGIGPGANDPFFDAKLAMDGGNLIGFAPTMVRTPRSPAIGPCCTGRAQPRRPTSGQPQPSPVTAPRSPTQVRRSWRTSSQACS